VKLAVFISRVIDIFLEGLIIPLGGLANFISGWW
jgi:hypothetical protein